MSYPVSWRLDAKARAVNVLQTMHQVLSPEPQHAPLLPTCHLPFPFPWSILTYWKRVDTSWELEWKGDCLRQSERNCFRNHEQISRVSLSGMDTDFLLRCGSHSVAGIIWTWGNPGDRESEVYLLAWAVAHVFRGGGCPVPPSVFCFGTLWLVPLWPTLTATFSSMWLFSTKGGASSQHFEITLLGH